MSGFSLQFDLSDLGRLNAALVDFDPDSVYRLIGEHLLTKARLGFKEQTSPKGEKWAPSKRAQEQGGQTLVDTAILKNSITYALTGQGLQFGPDATVSAYAAIHQFGGKAGRGHQVEIPRRQYIPEPEDLTEDDLKDMGEMVARALLEQLGKA